MNSLPSVIKTLFLAAVLGIPDCSRSQSLIGLWRNDIIQSNNPTGPTNQANTYVIVGFLQDGSFKCETMGAVGDGRDVTSLVGLYGSFEVIDTNHVKIQVAKMKFSKGQLVSFGGGPTTNSYSVSGGKLMFRTLVFHRIEKKN